MASIAATKCVDVSREATLRGWACHAAPGSLACGASELPSAACSSRFSPKACTCIGGATLGRGTGGAAFHNHLQRRTSSWRRHAIPPVDDLQDMPASLQRSDQILARGTGLTLFPAGETVHRSIALLWPSVDGKVRFGEQHQHCNSHRRELRNQHIPYCGLGNGGGFLHRSAQSLGVIEQTWRALKAFE